MIGNKSDRSIWTNQAGQDRDDRTAMTEQQGQDNGAAGLWMRVLGQDSWNWTLGRTAWTGQPERTVGILQPGQEREDRTART